MSASKEVKKKIIDKLKKEGVEKIAIFGSYSRGEEKVDSDIDILVKFSKPKSLLDISRMERELSKSIGIEVDLVTEKSLSPYIRKNVEKSKRVLA